MFFQPGESKYKVFLANAGDHKYCPFVVSIISEYQLHHLLNWASFVQRSISIIDQNRSGELMSVDPFGFYKLQVDEQA